MPWASRRRFIIVLIISAVIVAFLTIVLIATFYKTPSCSDGIQNQTEAGIDCGGSCAYLCTNDMQPPTVLFTKLVGNGAGRTDLIALIENKNTTAAAKNVPYRVALYGRDHIYLRTMSGTVDLPPGATVPVYIPGVASGTQVVTQAFLEIAASVPRWFALTSDPRIVPTVVRTTTGGTPLAPRVEAVLANPGITALSAARAIVLVRSLNKEVIAASETVVPLIPAQGQATAVFTWNGAFDGVPASAEVVPVIPLP